MENQSVSIITQRCSYIVERNNIWTFLLGELIKEQGKFCEDKFILFRYKTTLKVHKKNSADIPDISDRIISAESL